MSKLELLNTHKVAIFDYETKKLDRVTTVQDILSGFDTYIDFVDGAYVLVDYQDESEKNYLGDTLEAALTELNEYTEFFNNYPNGDDDEETWYSDFMHYFEEEKEFLGGIKMTKYNRVNSKIVADKVQNHIMELLEKASGDLSAQEVVQDRIESAKFEKLNEQYINARDVTEMMFESPDLLYRNYDIKEFLTELKINHNENDFANVYKYIISYHLDKLFNIGVIVNDKKKFFGM